VKGIAVFEMPDELLEEFVRVIKWFDQQHEDSVVEIFAETSYTAERLKEMFKELGFPNPMERKVH